ncbi:hypothetical protein [Nostoc sp.]
MASPSVVMVPEILTTCLTAKQTLVLGLRNVGAIHELYVST